MSKITEQEIDKLADKIIKSIPGNTRDSIKGSIVNGINHLLNKAALQNKVSDVSAENGCSTDEYGNKFCNKCKKIDLECSCEYASIVNERKDAVITVGQILKQAIELHELNPETIDKELGLQGSLIQLINDECYTNSIPIKLFKNLIVSLHIPFTTIEKAMLPTYRLIASKETKESLNKKPSGYMLWENEEAIIKYTERIKELMYERKDNVGVSDAIAFAEWISGYMNKDSWFRYHAKFRKWYVPGKGHFTTVGLYQEFKDSQPQKKEV